MVSNPREARVSAQPKLYLPPSYSKLQRHFDQALEDLRQIRISTEKVTKRAERIEDVQLADEGEEPTEEIEPPEARRLGDG